MPEPTFLNVHQITADDSGEQISSSQENVQGLYQIIQAAVYVDKASDILAVPIAARLCKILSLPTEGLGVTHAHWEKGRDQGLDDLAIQKGLDILLPEALCELKSSRDHWACKKKPKKTPPRFNIRTI